MTTQPRTLLEMQNRPTSYEVVATDGTTSIRLGFTAKRTKSSLLNFAHGCGQVAGVMDLIGDWDGEYTYAAQTGFNFGPMWVRFSGNTERGCHGSAGRVIT